MGKKILTLEDLCAYCEEQKMYRFNAQESGRDIVVQVPSNVYFKADEQEDEHTLITYVKAFHIGRNRNGSNVTKEAAEKAIPNMAYKPVLANFMTNPETNEEDFTSHDFVINDDGSVTYLEKQVGCFTADKPEIKYDEETKKEFVFAKMAIPRQYTNAAEIIERKNGTKVSVELQINDLSYNAKEKELMLNDIDVLGITLLGTDPNTLKEVGEGMQGARASLEDFSSKNNSMFSNIETNEQLIEALEGLKKTLESFNKSGKEEDAVDLENVNEFEDSNVEDGEIQAEDTTVTESEGTVIENEEADENTVAENENEQQEDEAEDETPETEASEENKEFAKNFEVRFEISHDEIRYALYNLIQQFEEQDNEWYSIDAVYDDHFAMRGWFNNQIYGMKYTKEDNEVSLVGDRWHLNQELLTDEELVQLNEMRSNYALMAERLANYERAELNAQRDAIFAEESYQQFLEADEFKSLISDKEKYSLEELRNKAEMAFAQCVRKTGSFSTQKAPAQRFDLGNAKDKPKKNSRYGNIFKDLEK